MVVNILGIIPIAAITLNFQNDVCPNLKCHLTSSACKFSADKFSYGSLNNFLLFLTFVGIFNVSCKFSSYS